MAAASPYVAQLESACGAIAERIGHVDWKLVYQSRSGPPSQPWLEPDILDHIRELHAAGRRDLVIAPVGFLSDHIEVLYDLDTEAAGLCRDLGIRMVRAKTVGTHPEFVRMIVSLIGSERICAADCCPRPQRLKSPSTASCRPATETGLPGS
jgi:ferrochelatase